MYAIVETGGKQYRVKPGDTVAVEKLSGEPGEILDLDRVLLIAGNGDSETRVGSPGVAGAVVRAEVLAHFRGQKIIIFRYKSKVRYRRKTGHRQSLTRLRITDILVDGASSLPAAEPYQAEPEPAVAAAPAVAVAEEPAAIAVEAPAGDVAAAEAPMTTDMDAPEVEADAPDAESDPETPSRP
jgi:large subunit ribosomal protein L21